MHKSHTKDHSLQEAERRQIKNSLIIMRNKTDDLLKTIHQTFHT
jgi:mannosyltransferase OCH1-like enzyme